MDWKRIPEPKSRLPGAATRREARVPVRVEAHRDRLLAVKRDELPQAEVGGCPPAPWRKELHRDFAIVLAETDLPERPDCGAANAYFLKGKMRGCGRGSPKFTRADILSSFMLLYAINVPIPLGRRIQAIVEVTNLVESYPRLPRILAAQSYPLLFATLSGTHLCGFLSPDSDSDLLGAHVRSLTVQLTGSRRVAMQPAPSVLF